MTTIERKLFNFYLAKARENLENTMWFRSAPKEAKERIELTLTAIDSCYIPQLIGSHKKKMCVVAEAKDPEIGESIEIFIPLD